VHECGPNLLELDIDKSILQCDNVKIQFYHHVLHTNYAIGITNKVQIEPFVESSKHVLLERKNLKIKRTF